MAIAVAQTAVVARALGPAGLGELSIALALPALVLGLIDANSGEAVVRYVARYHAEGDARGVGSIVRLALTADVAAIVVAIPVLAVVVAMTGLGTTGALTAFDVALGMSVVALSSPMSTARSTLIALRRFRLVSMCDIVAALLGLAAVSVAVLDDSTRAVLIGYVVASFGGLVLTAWVATRCLRRAGGQPWWGTRTSDLGSERRSVIRFMIATDGTASLSTVVREVDVLIVGSVVGASGAGAYRLASSSVAPIGAVITSLQNALYPRFAASVDALRHVRLRSPLVRGGALLGAVVIAVGVAIAPLGVRLIGGAEFADASAAARWAIAGAGVVLALFWVRPALLSSGQVRYLLVNSTVVAVVSVIGFYVGARTAGIAGVAASRAVVTSIGGSSAAALHFLRWRRTNLTDSEAGHLVHPPEPPVDSPQNSSHKGG
jgi:O-antigen/teichoic acid export membrane protein